MRKFGLQGAEFSQRTEKLGPKNRRVHADRRMLPSALSPCLAKATRSIISTKGMSITVNQVYMYLAAIKFGGFATF